MCQKRRDAETEPKSLSFATSRQATSSGGGSDTNLDPTCQRPPERPRPGANQSSTGMASPLQDRVHVPPPPPEDGERPPLPELCEDLVREILVRLPPDEPEYLMHAAAVCKPWLRILCDPAFRRDYLAHHRTPPIMGLLYNVCSGADRDLARLAPTTRLVTIAADHEGLDVLDARHGRVLYYDDEREAAFIVWDPITDERWEVAPPVIDHRVDFWAATVLCGDIACDHVDCHSRDGFMLVFIGADAATGDTTACSYHKRTGSWSDFATAKSPSVVALNMKPGALVSGTIFFTTTRERLVGYRFTAPLLFMLDPPVLAPVPYRDPLLLPGTHGRLQFAMIHMCSLLLWEAQLPPNGTAASWVPQASISLSSHGLIHNTFLRMFLVGFSEEHQLLYFGIGRTVHSVHLITRGVSRISISGNFLGTIIPFGSFCTADIVQRSLGRYIAGA